MYLEPTMQLGTPYSWSLGVFVLCTALRVFAIVFFADFAIAFAHALMDKFGDPTCRIRILARIFGNNRHHHAYPNALLEKSPLANATETMVIGAFIIAIAWIFGSLSWEVWLFALTIAMSALVHRWQHLPVDDVPWLFEAMRRFGLAQSRRQHMEHHRRHDVNYAVMMNWTNVLLERTKAFRIVEWVMARMFCLQPYNLDEISRETRKATAKQGRIAGR